MVRNRIATIEQVKYDAEIHQYWDECCFPECAGTTFKRYPDLKRHFEATHVSPVVHCECPGCSCSSTATRKYKMNEHINSVYEGVGVVAV